jgi:alanine racemase
VELRAAARFAGVVLWGRQASAEISVAEVAAWQETIACEVPTGVGQGVPRILQ